MATGNNNNKNSAAASSSHKLNESIDELKQQIGQLQSKVNTLENKVELLESEVIISKSVSNTLSKEIDRLDQYHRRSNIIIKNIFLPEKESDEDIKNKVVKIIKDLLPSGRSRYRQSSSCWSCEKS